MTTNQERLGRDTALIFVLNKRYLRPLKVLLYSLAKHDTLQSCDRIIVTDDPAVERDPFIRRYATSIEHYGPDDLAPFSTIRKEAINERSHVSFAPKYTFFKFIGFKPRGYRRHILIDADMLCMNPLDEHLLAQPYSAKAIFEVKGKFFPIREESVDKRMSMDEAVDYVERLSVPHAVPCAQKINSGILVLQDDALADGVFEKAIALASEEAFNQEQAATTRIIEGFESFLQLPMWYNTRRRIFESLGAPFYARYEDRMRLFHYTPGKPWARNAPPCGYIDDPWFAVEEEAREWIADLSASARP